MRASRTLFVADLHLGKSATFRARGLPVPSGTTQDNLRRLAALVQTRMRRSASSSWATCCTRSTRSAPPPSRRAPGPMSMTQSLAATSRISCSTTTTVLPASTSALQLRHQPVDVGRMQAGGRLVEHVQRVAALRPLQLGGELDALRLAAGQLGGRLAQAQVAEADVAQQRERLAHRGLVGEEGPGVVDGHREHVGDVLAVPGDLRASPRCSARRGRSGRARRRWA